MEVLTWGAQRAGVNAQAVRAEETGKSAPRMTDFHVRRTFRTER